MGIRYEDLNDMHMDVLREIGNIGAGNAATSLSVMLGQPIDIALPKVQLLDFNSVTDAMGGPETLTYGVLLSLTGEIDGMVMFLLNKDFAHLMLNALMGEAFASFDEMDEMALSAIREVGNILSAAYVKSISELTGLDIHMSVPEVSIDMAGALLSMPLIKFGAVGDRVLFIEENFQSVSESVASNMILFAEPTSLSLMLSKLGIS
ncbi:MAG: chemotaxis protein CheC [Oscillospiraceae bacterium]|nr:chemotaxis protein CheC [Oscillospiraceae bacterium]